MQLPALYKRRADGGIHCWTVAAEQHCTRTVSGTLDGEEVVTDWTEHEGKNVGRSNGTTAEQQALLVAQRKWDKKKEKGYTEDPDDVDEPLAYIKPMLARRWQKRKHLAIYPVLVQPKLDGIRAVARKEGLFSRGGKPLRSTPHVFDALRPLLDQGWVLDGELYSDDLAADFDTICSLSKRKEAAADSYRIQYHVYDLCNVAHDGGYMERYEALQALLHGLPDCIRLVETRAATTACRVDELLATAIANGYEGIMVRSSAAPYQQARCDALLKYKQFLDGEFTVLRVNPGEGNSTGIAGSLTCLLPDGRTFNSNIKGGKTLCKSWLEYPELVLGKRVTVQYGNLTPDGIPRFSCVKGLTDA